MMRQRSIRVRKLFPAIVFLLLSVSFPGQAEDTKKIENLIYSILAFDGHNFKATFCREGSPMIYFLADTDNIISVRKTFIFYWPLISQWRIDPALLNVQIKGKLEIKGNNIKPAVIEPVLFTYTNLPDEKAEAVSPIARTDMERGEYFAEDLRILEGGKAVAAIERYEKIMEDYRETEQLWQEKMRAYEKWKREMIVKIREAKDQGKDVSGLVEEVQSRQPNYAELPGKPDYYIYPLSEAFILNLKEGEYRIRLVDDRGSIVEGSEKKLHVFKNTRSNGILFEYVSKDKITNPKESKIPAAVLYFDGSSDVYLQPYLQDEYNELYYNKLAENEARGNKNKTKWERTKRLNNMWLRMKRQFKQSEIVLEDLFYVSQNAERGAGYEIVYWDGRPDGPQQYIAPSFRAFHISMNARPDIITVKLTSFKGNDLPMSSREIRIVRKTGFLVIILILSLAPLVILGYTVYKRQKLYSSGP